MANSGGHSQERWLLTRKTWRYMADAGRKLIPESVRNTNDPASIQQIEQNFQELCRKEKSFLLWRRTKNERVQCSAPTSPLPLSLDTSEDDITVIEKRARDGDSSPCEPLFDLEHYGASVEAYQRRATYPRPYKNSPRSSAAYDLSEAEPVQCHLEEDSRLVTIGSIEDLLGEDGRRRAVRHIGVQTETCLIDPLTHHPLEIDSGKCTEGEFSSPEALSPLSMIDIRAESFRSPTSTTSGVSSAGMTVECTSPPEALRKDSMIQANLPPTEFELLKEEERPLSIDEEPDKFADKLSKYFKMARRDSVTRTKDKKDRFKTVNYDKTLRNIKSKRVNPDTLEDTSEDVKPLDIDEIIRQARLESPPSVVSPVPAQPHPVKKKKKRRGIQVGEPLPQYILDSLRNVFSSFRPIRKLSKTESDASAECSSDPLSPRYSIAVSDGTLHRDPLSDVESPLGALSPTSSTRNSVDPTQDPHDRFISSELTAFDPLGNIILSSSPPPDTTFPTSSDHDITPSREYPSFPPHSSHPIQTFFARRLSSVRTPSLSHQSLQQSHRRSRDSGQGGQSTSSSEQIDARAGVTADGKRSGFLSTVMRTGRGASSTVSSGASSNSSNSRGTTKRLWRMRSKSQSRFSLTSVCLWTPQEGQQWSDIQNRLVVLPSCQLQQLCPVEATLLRQLAVEKLAEMNLGYPVRVPKDGSPPPATKPKRRQKAISRKHAGIFDLSRKDESGGKNRTSGMVFGISLTKCLENDRLLGRSVTSDLTCVDEHITCRQSRAASHSSCSSWAATDKRGRGSCDSIDRSEKRPSLEESSLTFTHLDRCESLTVQPVQVPRFVDACIKHIDRHGLNTIGIFRVSSSKKRSRQLRDEFDTGKDIELEEDCCPHVVATLLKEFLRDMERPLLPHELYAPFLATQRVRNRRQQLEMMQWLLRLLPPANRDTLSVLLSFLKRVADCSADRRNSAGDWLTGNRMDSSNLATLFAPNVLHSLAQATAGIVAAVNSGGGGSGGGNGGGCGEQAAAHTAERIDAINVFRSLIDCHGKLFQVSSEDLHSVYLVMMERNPEYLDVLLRRRYAGPTSPEQGSPTIAFQQTSAKNAPLRANSIPSTEFEYRNNSAQQLMESCPLYKEDTPPSIPGVDFSPSSQAGTNILIEKPKQGVIGNIGRRAEKFSPTQGAKWLRRRVRSCHGAKRRSIDETSGISSYTWFRKRDKSTGSCCSDSSGESSECRHRRSSVPHITSTEGVGRSTRRQRNTRPANKENPHRHRSSSSDLEPQSTLATTILNATLRVTMSSPSSNFQKTQSSARSPGVWPADSESQRAPAGGTSRVTETRVATDDVEDTFTCSLRIQPVVSGEASRNVRCGDHWRDLVALESPCSTSKQPARLPDEQEQWNEDVVSPSLANNGDTIDVINTSDSNVLTDEVYSIFSSQAGNECRIGASPSLYHQCYTVYHRDKHARESSFPHPELATTDQGINNTQRQTRQIDTPSSTSARKGRARKSASVEPGSCPSASGTPRIATNSQTVHLWKRHEIISSACDTST